MQDEQRHTVAVDDAVFRQVYDSPASLPGRHRWLTSDQDVREIEKLLNMPPDTIGAPLWVSGERKTCAECDRTISWLDIVASGLARVHSAEMIANVILGEQKYVNTEAPKAIAHVSCVNCGASFEGLRSFKCHNWAYAKPALLDVIQQMERGRASSS
ncbi:MAG TPA: hypothetical protein VF557_00190 [Jatrophihabitans sp.]|jgi:hypothetical protein|uniref:hypothetical protein n=1 Tax=Jatrophihabitans sp. TaxID=1932789 RepID=UPI002F25DDD6